MSMLLCTSAFAVTDDELRAGVTYWASAAHAGTTAQAVIVINCSNGTNIAYGYQWNGDVISVMDAMDELVLADENLSSTKVSNNSYYGSLTYGENVASCSWGIGLFINGGIKFSAHNANNLAANDLVIFTYDDMAMSVPTLSNVIYATMPATQADVTYNLIGCTGDEANPAEIDEETEELDLFFTLEDGFTWAGAEISVTMNGVAVSDIMADFEADPFFTWEPETGNLYIAGVEDYLAAPIVVTIIAKESLVFPEVFTPATFESITTGANGVFYDPTLVLGNNEWLDGSFLFGTYYSNTWGDYYSDCVVSSLKDSTLTADYSNPVSYLAAAVNHAAEGNNYVAWNQNFYGIAPVKLGEAQVVSGMAVTNTSAFVNYILDAANNFHDTFTLTVSGYNNEELTGTIEFVLADFTTDTLKYAEQWQWLDLTSLGAVDKLMFNTLCADYMAPAYFCFDNLGGQAADCQLGAMTIIEPEPIYYTFAILNSENGTISSNVPCGALVENTEITVLASPATGYHFVSWSNGETANPYTFTLTEDTTISAIFEKDPETGLDELHTSAEKVMINGQVYILREGVRYTITGQVAE